MSRIPKVLLASLAGVGTFAAIAATICAGIYVAASETSKNTLVNHACSTSAPVVTHTVEIQHDAVMPAKTAGALCDALTITNLDDKVRLVSFGPHENHVPYDGIAGKLLTKGQSLTVTLVQSGEFTFHDHIQDQVAGSFTVTPVR